MKTVKLSSLDITPITLGTWGIGGPPFWGETTEAVAVDTIQTAIDSGVNCIDMAPVYGFGRSEEIVGRAIKGKRDKVVIATKFGLRWKSPKLAHLYKDTSENSIREELENSLQRLGTDYIDLYQLHWPNPDTSPEESMETLVKLKDEGKIREIGVSNLDSASLERVLQYAPVASLQPCYNMLQREVEDETLPFCKENRIGVLAYSPLASGLLTGKYNATSDFDDWRGKKNFGLFVKEKWEPAMKKISRLNNIADRSNMPLNHIAIRWLTRQAGVTSVIVGANSGEQIKENLKAFDSTIREEAWSEIEAIL